jgi:multisubunit Na+/H+ antiporter MnhG subunit
MARNVIIDILLGAAVALTLASAVGVLAMHDVYQKVHFVTPLALIAPLLVGLAVLVASGWAVNSSLMWLALLFVVAGSPFLSHATIRAARIRDNGDWRAGAGPAGEPDARDGGQAAGD